MKILHKIFDLITAKNGQNWLSVKFYQYWHRQQDKDNENWVKYANSQEAIDIVGKTYFFEIPGAGQLALSEKCDYSTSKTIGFAFDISWGMYGFCGGVLGRNEAKRLAETILNELSKCKITEEEELVGWEKEWDKIT